MKGSTLINSFKILISYAGSRALGFINIVLLLTLISITDFGVFMLFLSTVNLISIFSLFSLQNVIFSRFGGKTPEDSSFLGNTILVLVGLGILGAVLTWSGSEWIVTSLFREDAVAVFAVLSPIVFSNSVIAVFRALLIASDRINRSAIIEVFERLCRMACLAYFIIAGGTLYDIALAFLLCSVATMLLGLFMSFKELKQFNYVPSGTHIKGVLKLGSSFFVSSLGVIFIFQADKVMLGALSDTVNVGYYVLISTVAGFLLLPHQALSAIFKPFASKNYKEGNMELIQKVYTQLANWSTGINSILFLFMLSFPVLVLSLFVREDLETFSEDLTIYHVITSFTILAIYHLAYVVVGPTTSLLQMTGRHRNEAYNTTVFFVLNLILNIVLIPRFGLLGAAMATLVSGLVRIAMQGVQIRNALKLDILSTFSTVLFFTCSVMALALLLLEVDVMLKIAALLIVGIPTSYILFKRHRGRIS